jgi:3'-5' exonuclease
MKNLQSIPLEKILFLDIETVPVEENFSDLNENIQKHWSRKYQYIKHDEMIDEAEGFAKQAGIYAEFGKIICISIGRIKFENQEKILSIKSFFGDDEKILLQEFSELLTHKNNFKFVCGHNIREFDIPFISRRMLIHQVELPDLFDVSGKKNYELDYLIDTLNCWKFGDFKHYTSLALLADLLQIPTPKFDIEGKDVARVYYKENDLSRIEKYCKHDVAAVANLFMKFRMENIFNENQIRFVD